MFFAEVNTEFASLDLKYTFKALKENTTFKSLYFVSDYHKNYAQFIAFCNELAKNDTILHLYLEISGCCLHKLNALHLVFKQNKCLRKAYLCFKSSVLSDCGYNCGPELQSVEEYKSFFLAVEDDNFVLEELVFRHQFHDYRWPTQWFGDSVCEEICKDICSRNPQLKWGAVARQIISCVTAFATFELPCFVLFSILDSFSYYSKAHTAKKVVQFVESVVASIYRTRPFSNIFLFPSFYSLLFLLSFSFIPCFLLCYSLFASFSHRKTCDRSGKKLETTSRKKESWWKK